MTVLTGWTVIVADDDDDLQDTDVDETRGPAGVTVTKKLARVAVALLIE